MLVKGATGVTSLIELKLNNVAGDFENMDFKPFVVLEGLYMTRGELTNIPPNIEYIAGTICYLSFAYNHIATLDGMFNIMFEKLRYLYLLHNKISIINPQLLKFPLLKHIYLQYNRLKQLEDMRFSNWGIGHYGILSMAIKPNPWHCNESTCVLIKTLCRRGRFAYFREEPIRIGLSLSDMVCESPVDVKGEAFKFVFQVAIQEMNQCPKSEFIETHRHYHLFNTVERPYNAIWYDMILHTWLSSLRYEYKREFGHTKNTPYFALAGELWGVFCDDFGKITAL